MILIYQRANDDDAYDGVNDDSNSSADDDDDN